MKIRRSEERGVTEIGWLHSRHSFSFGDYHDREHMGYRSLRVINDDIIEPGQGFGTHGHQNMEIISLVFEGALAHRDSLGHEETLRPGEVQVMSAGKGIEHSEFNPSKSERTHLLQIWIIPEQRGLDSSYQQKPFSINDRTNKLLRVAGPKRPNSDQALTINQDADLFMTRIEAGSVKYSLQPGRAAWIHLVSGVGFINDTQLASGDAVAIENGDPIVLGSKDGAAEFLLFDLK